MSSIPTNPDDLQPYLDAGYQLLPLFRWDRTSTHKNGKPRQDGKRPMDNDWTKKPYNNENVVAHMEEGSNVGVRLDATQLVVDVDPRNMPEGRDTFAEFCEAVGLDPDLYPKVETGSGGLHVYMRKPKDVPVLDSLDGYEGVEFKTRGRQVVAAGSRHPNGNMYEWDFLGPELMHAREAPERLVNLIRRPAQSTHKASGGGEYSQQEVAEMLDALDPEDYRDEGKWRTLMMACHHASAGDARSEFIEWSTRDPLYQDDSWIIGRRWDSLHRERAEGVVTHRTLHKELRDAGKEDAIPKIEAHMDFDDDIELPWDEDDVPEHERMGPMARMNTKFWAVTVGGKFRIMYRETEPTFDPPRDYWVTMDKQSFMDMLANRKVEKLDKKGEPTVSPVGKEWLEWPYRRTARGVIFDPAREHGGYLNLWNGWGVEPRPGKWDYTKELIEEVLCDGDFDSAVFVMKWMAYMVQKPWEAPGVAICFHGDKGTGKSTLGEALVSLAGNHGWHVTSSDRITGQFNAHLQDCLMLFADEAVLPTDKASQNRLKGLITERHMTYEKKGVDTISGMNRVHVMMASNDDWFVDAGATDGERRYFVSRVGNRRQGDTDFFGRLRRELYEQGGLSAMLHDLQLLDLKDWAPRGNVPETYALTDQKVRNLSPVHQWWFNALDTGDFPCYVTDEELYTSWEDGPMRAFHQDLKDSFHSFCQVNKIRPGSMNKSMDRYFWQELKKVSPNMQEKRDVVPEERLDVQTAGGSNRARCMAIPDLAQSRKDFASVIGGEINWNLRQ